MDFLATSEGQLVVGVAVGLIAVGAAYVLFSSKRPKVCLDPEKFKEFKLVKKTQLSHNVAKFRFALPTPTSVLGLPIGQHISCRGKDSQGEEIIKPYTPTTLDSDVGYFELVIKMYPQGRMSHHFREMHEGDYLAVKGPKGRFKYQPGQVREFGMIAGGSGITPMFQVTRAILENSNDKTKVHLIYANVTLEDILLKDELDNLAKNYPDQFKVYFVLNQATSHPVLVYMATGGFADDLEKLSDEAVADFVMLQLKRMFSDTTDPVQYLVSCWGTDPNILGCYSYDAVGNSADIYDRLRALPPEGWNGGVGFVSKEMIQAHCPPPASDIQILRCGPPPMNKAMAAHLEALGYSPEMQFQF